MKRILFILLLQFSVVFVFGQTSQKYVNIKDGFKLREYPSLDAKILTIIPYDEMVVLFREYSNEIVIDNIPGKWAKVFYSNLIGWVFDGYLSDTNSFGEMPYIAQGNLLENIKR
jgi:hypothetical protein